MVGEFADIGREGFDLLDRLKCPEVDNLPAQLPRPTRSGTLLRDLALFVMAAPFVLGALVGTAQLGSAAGLNTLRVDTRSSLEVDYGTWEVADFAAVSPGLLEEVVKDRSLFPDIYGGAASPLMVPGDFWTIPFQLEEGSKPRPAPSWTQATGETVSVRATIHLLWGILSLEAGSNEYLEDMSDRSALPLLVVVDARGSGEGWHLTVRASEEQTEEGGSDVSRFELVLPDANIKSIDGYAAPGSLAPLPMPLSEADQMLVEAEANEGMGTFGMVPSIYEVIIGRQSRGDPVLSLDLSLIASP